MKCIFDVTPLARANNTTSSAERITNSSNTSSTDAGATSNTPATDTPKSANEQAMRCMLQAWDYFELIDDYTSADLIKALAEEIFGGDAWGSAVQAYVEEDAITKHQGETD